MLNIILFNQENLEQELPVEYKNTDRVFSGPLFPAVVISSSIHMQTTLKNSLHSFLPLPDLLKLRRSGFGPHHSIETALTEVTCELLAEIAGYFSVFIVLAFSKTFGAVDHCLFLSIISSSLCDSTFPCFFFFSFVLFIASNLDQ